MILSETYKKRLLELSGIEIDAEINFIPADLEFAKKHWDEQIRSGEYSEMNFEDTMTYVDENISKSVSVNGKTVGVYLLGETQMPEILEFYDEYFSKSHGLTYKLEDGIDIEKYKNKKGIYGVFLYVLPKYRDKGIGKMLIKYGESLGDYVYGMHDIKLNNLDHWLKRRVLIGRLYDKGVFNGYITATVI